MTVRVSFLPLAPIVWGWLQHLDMGMGGGNVGVGGWEGGGRGEGGGGRSHFLSQGLCGCLVIMIVVQLCGKQYTVKSCPPQEGQRDYNGLRGADDQTLTITHIMHTFSHNCFPDLIRNYCSIVNSNQKWTNQHSDQNNNLFIIHIIN